MSLWSRRLEGALVVASVAAIGLSMTRSPNTRVTQGECRTVNGAQVCVWAETADDTLTAFGATIPMQAVENAPNDAPMAWPPVADATIPLPDVVRTASGFDNMTVYWEPHGHPPGPYLAPHFDFHFNAISSADVAAIDCSDSAKPARLSSRYELPDVPIPNMGTLVGLCVPGMGMHALPSSELRSTKTFQKTMVLGYYHARPIFLEPMITRETLLKRRSFALDIPRVPGEPATVREPARFRAEYDRAGQSYRFVFSGLTSSTR